MPPLPPPSRSWRGRSRASPRRSAPDLAFAADRRGAGLSAGPRQRRRHRQLANAAAYATLALGLNIVVGFAGLLDLGYAAFFAIGAYTYGILTAFQVKPEWSSVLGAVPLPGPGREDAGRDRRWQRRALHPLVLARPALAGALAAFFGILFGAPTLRLRGDYLAIVTLGFGEIVPIVVRNWSDLTNGAAGLNGVPRRACSAAVSASMRDRITTSPSPWSRC